MRSAKCKASAFSARKYCYGEYVERPEEFRPALERALRAGKTALVNVVGDRTIGHPNLGGNLLGSTRV